MTKWQRFKRWCRWYEGTIGVALLLLIIAATLAFAQPTSTPPPVVVRPTPYNGPVYCQITSLGAAVNLVTASCSTGSILPNPSIIQICVSGAAVRYRSDGTNPTAAIGIPVAVGACYQYSGPIAAVKFIQQAATATLDIESFP